VQNGAAALGVLTRWSSMIGTAPCGLVMVCYLPLAWMTSCGVPSAPPVLANTPTAAVGFGEAPWIAGEASKGE
jgi:hypothetical protein